MPLAIDLFTSANSILIGFDKYVYLASPGIYAILAAAMCGPLLASAVCFGIAAYGVARWQGGPEFTFASTLGIEDHRSQAKFLARHVQPNDLVILPATWNFNGQIEESAFTYFIIAHYKGEWSNPVLLLTTPLTDKTRAQLSRFHQIWVAGSSLEDCQRLLPGIPFQDVYGATSRDSVWGIECGSPNAK